MYNISDLDTYDYRLPVRTMYNPWLPVIKKIIEKINKKWDKVAPGYGIPDADSKLFVQCCLIRQ